MICMYLLWLIWSRWTDHCNKTYEYTLFYQATRHVLHYADILLDAFLAYVCITSSCLYASLLSEHYPNTEGSQQLWKLDVPSAIFDLEQEWTKMYRFYQMLFLCIFVIFMIFTDHSKWPNSPGVIFPCPQRQWPIKRRIPQKPFVTWCALQRSSLECWDVGKSRKKQ